MQTKVELELLTRDDGVQFLNFWNYIDGNDVVCKIIDGKLFLSEDDLKEITLKEFLNLVEKSISGANNKL